ncbi:MAG: hypothetical protein A4E19_04515 [Nitrospira sp. SG-bin1]|nr:MAG: hypothetical protein A4E19_04515 [Nitrospira sp. SG-bin1]
MNVKGFILEDNQGRELVMGCERPYTRIRGTYFLRGWQRRRLIPLRYSERELRQIVGEVLIALDDLSNNLLAMHSNRTVTALLSEKSPEGRKLPRKTA